MLEYFDFLILCFSMGGFIVFLLLQSIVFRLIKQESVLKGIIRLYTIIGALFFVFQMLLLSTQQRPIIDSFFIAISTWFLYSLLVFLYIIGVFGVIESSLRIRLLQIIVKAGEKGISYQTITKVYNRDRIIKKRLVRLITSGELTQKNSLYQINKHFSFFYVPAYFARILKKLYGFNNRP